MQLERTAKVEGTSVPLSLTDCSLPSIERDEVLIRISACGVCHTELDEIEGRMLPPHLPVIPGHQVVGRIAECGKSVQRLRQGDRVGVAWIFSACGTCKFCLAGEENLCPDFQATGRDANGGYAEYIKIRESFAYLIPEIFSDAEAAPLLCAGAIGYRSMRLSGVKNGERLGLTGFGASAHLVLKMARHRFPDSPIFVFARSRNEQEFARHLGAVWAGDTIETPPEKLDAIIDTTPVWKPVVEALKNLEPGGRLIINAIRKEDSDKAVLSDIDYTEHLWLEKGIKTVANVTRRDVSEFLQLAAEIPIRPEFQEFELEDANRALIELKQGKIRGAKVLRVDQKGRA
jgi:propanol-preferring alcohol dehydrogenase